MDRLTPLMERLAHTRVLQPVIVEAKGSRLRDIFFLTKGLTLDIGSKWLDRIPLDGFGMLERFNYVTAILKRNDIFDLAQDRDVKKIYPDRIMHALSFPTLADDEIYEVDGKRFTSTHHIRRLMGTDRANQMGYDGRGVVVTALDTGSRRYHEQIRRATVKSTMRGQPSEDNGHGTWVASAIGGLMRRDAVISRVVGRDVFCHGMAPRCGLISLKCLGYIIGAGSNSQILKSLHMAFENYGADVVNLSLGGPIGDDNPENSPFYKPFKMMTEQGGVVCTAAGNSGAMPGTIDEPGFLDDALTVGAYDPYTGEVADFSSRGPTPEGIIKPDCIAPGVRIDSGVAGMLTKTNRPYMRNYAWLSGTSMATPLVSGLIACAKQMWREKLGRILTMEEIKRMLEERSKEHYGDKNSDSGWGPIDWQMFEDWIETEYHGKPTEINNKTKEA